MILAAMAVAGCGGGPGPGAESPSVTQDPDRARLADLLRVAREAEGRGDRAGAESRWEEVLSLRPRNADALYATARLRRSRGDLPGALARLEALRAEEPQGGRGYLLAAEVLSDPSSGPCQDLARAEAFAREAVARNPEESGPPLALGRVLLLAGRAPEAADRLEVAARMNPRDADSRSLLGAVHLRSGRRVEAARWFREALRCGRVPGVGAAPAGVPGEGDTAATLEVGRRPSGGELRAAAGLSALGIPVGGARAGGPPPEEWRSRGEAALGARGTGEALLDPDSDGRPDGAAVAGPEGTVVAVLSAGGEVVLHR